MSGASERVNGRASGPVIQSIFLAVLDRSAVGERRGHLFAKSEKEYEGNLREKETS